jgi:hypothetical protein
MAAIKKMHAHLGGEEMVIVKLLGLDAHHDNQRVSIRLRSVETPASRKGGETWGTPVLLTLLDRKIY